MQLLPIVRYIKICRPYFGVVCTSFKIINSCVIAPYGIREPTEKIGTKSSRKNDRKSKFPTKIMYTFHQIMHDLLCFSALHLKIGGRIVTWIPVFRYSHLFLYYCFLETFNQAFSIFSQRRLFGT